MKQHSDFHCDTSTFILAGGKFDGEHKVRSNGANIYTCAMKWALVKNESQPLHATLVACHLSRHHSVDLSPIRKSTPEFF